MEKCGACGEEKSPVVIVKVIDANGERLFCHNCLTLAVEEKSKFVNNPDFICDVTGQHGAIKFISTDEEYTLERDIFFRLINTALKPEEYFILINKYSPYNFMLHADFYTESGEAIQPNESE